MLNDDGPISGVTGLPGPLAPGQIVTVYGGKLSPERVAASEGTTATVLGGLTVLLKDAKGVEHTAPLLTVSGEHVTFLVPADAAVGPATLTFQVSKDSSSRMSVFVSDASPALYSYRSGEKNLAVGWVTQPDSEGNENVQASLTCEEGKCEPAQLLFREGATEARLRLSGNGMSKADLEQARIVIGAESLPFVAVLPGGRIGEEFFECILPASLAGSGLVPVEVVSRQQRSNRVWLLF
jgi:uncharacterized protein (TIGR03437 family)